MLGNLWNHYFLFILNGIGLFELFQLCCDNIIIKCIVGNSYELICVVIDFKSSLGVHRIKGNSDMAGECKSICTGILLVKLVFGKSSHLHA